MQNNPLEKLLRRAYSAAMNAAAVIVAAGSGNRFGSEVPKQYQKLGPLYVWEWSYRVFASHANIDQIIVVIPVGDTERFPDNVRTVVGGASRTESVLNGLNALTASKDTPVLIHDAARPGVTASVVNELLQAITRADGAAPAVPVSDALKHLSNTLRTVEREDLFRVQTPQIFRLGEIKAALADAGEALVDDLDALQRAGKSIELVKGDRRLEKITHPGDLAWMETMLMSGETRMGSGFDVHMFETGDAVTLCGVKIPHTARLKGHSDADAGWHALTDAILGALALGDIGDHFPPSDEKWRDVSSDVFLKHATHLARQHGYAIGNADITLICEHPKVKPHREAMRQSTADCLGISLDRISVKATTTEGLGFTGRGEGIAAQAVVTLTKRTQAED